MNRFNEIPQEGRITNNAEVVNTTEWLDKARTEVEDRKRELDEAQAAMRADGRTNVADDASPSVVAFRKANEAYQEAVERLNDVLILTGALDQGANFEHAADLVVENRKAREVENPYTKDNNDTTNTQKINLLRQELHKENETISELPPVFTHEGSYIEGANNAKNNLTERLAALEKELQDIESQGWWHYITHLLRYNTVKWEIQKTKRDITSIEESIERVRQNDIKSS
jgi:hypothetical protein